ncbi:hypothetical protein JW859_14445 [bacterium]|nr:hypothetical protein [bacterium]
MDRTARRRAEDGLWDLGPRGCSSSYCPLSVAWRRRIDRRFDWSARVLAVLART